VTSSKATPTPPFESLLRAALVSPSQVLTSCVAAPGETKVTNAPPSNTEPQSTLTGAAQHVTVEKINPMASKAIVPTTGASDQSASAPPIIVQPHELTIQAVAPAVAPAFVASDIITSGPPNLKQPHLVAKQATTTTTLGVPRGTTVPAASKVLDPNLKSRLAKLRTTLTEARHTQSGALVWALGQVMCFMLPKQTLMPSKLVNVYGILAHDVREGAAYGTCIMQDGSFNTFSFPVMLVAVERMHDDIYSTRCPQVRLAQWLEVKCLPTSNLDGEIKLR
jgi:hypothetical protein